MNANLSLESDFLSFELISPLLQLKTSQVQMLRKVRHENIVLFMGVCMNPPNLCIVTEYIKGKSLHFYIHERGKTYTERQSMQIMEQVCL